MVECRDPSKSHFRAEHDTKIEGVNDMSQKFIYSYSTGVCSGIVNIEWRKQLTKSNLRAKKSSIEVDTEKSWDVEVA